MIYAYLRVSSQLQADANGTDSQRNSVIQWLAGQGLNINASTVEFFEDIAVSGKSMKRPAFEQMLAKLQKNDTILFYDLSRAGRTLKGLIEFTEDMIRRDIRVVFIRNAIDISTSMGRLVLTIMAGIAEFQREEIASKISDGVRARIARGGRWGAAPVLTPDKLATASRMKADGKTQKQIAAAVGCCTKTLKRRLP